MILITRSSVCRVMTVPSCVRTFALILKFETVPRGRTETERSRVTLDTSCPSLRKRGPLPLMLHSSTVSS